MDLLFFWNRLRRRKPRSVQEIRQWFPYLFDAEELELIENGVRRLEVREGGDEYTKVFGFLERLGFWLAVEPQSIAYRRSRIFVISEYLGSAVGRFRDEWPLGLTVEEKERFAVLLEESAWFGFRNVGVFLLIRLEQEFEPEGTATAIEPEHYTRIVSNSVASLDGKEALMFGWRWNDRDEAISYLPSLGNSALGINQRRIPENSFAQQKAKLLDFNESGSFGINRTLLEIDEWSPEVVRARHWFLLSLMMES